MSDNILPFPPHDIEREREFREVVAALRSIPAPLAKKPWRPLVETRKELARSPENLPGDAS